MKKSFVTKIVSFLIVSISAQVIHAGELYCGANTEEIPGSNVYNKLVFWEKAEASSAVVRFLLSDGTIIKADSTLALADWAKITNGTLAIGTSTLDGKVSVFSGCVVKNQSGNITYENLAVSVSVDGGTPILMANGVSIVCKEM